MAGAAVTNMAFEAVGRTLVIVHNDEYPSDAEWDAYLQVLLAHINQWSDRRSLVVTTGGSPSSKQRARMAEVVGDHVAPTAVLTASAPVVATVGALHVRNAAIRSFPQDDLEGALGHLGLREDERKRILSRLPALQEKVGGQSTPSPA